MHVKYNIYKHFLKSYGYIKSFNKLTNNINIPIDFVVTWVDGNDMKWKQEKQKHFENCKENSMNGEKCYRDWELFKYWFRSVEKYAPWVNKVYLVTYGHFPKWLNTNCSKLVIVNHKDFIPSKYLPTFSSIPIELNIHRIKGLSENFVYFNDDVFLSQPVYPESFFINGKIKYCSITSPLKNDAFNDSFNHQLFSNLSAINGLFKKDISKVIKSHPEKWFAHQYGNGGIRYNLKTYEDSYIYGMYFSHLGVPFTKCSFESVWNIIPK